MGSSRWQIELHSDGLLLLLGPTGYTDPSTAEALNSATCTGRLFDNDRRSLIAATSGADATDITVTDGTKFATAGGESVHLQLDDLSHILRTTASVAANVVTLTASIGASRTAEAKDWSYMAVQLGADISMLTYGTAVAGGNLWGYVGNIDYDLDLLLAMDLRAEIDFDGGSGLRKYVTMESIRVVEGGG